MSTNSNLEKIAYNKPKFAGLNGILILSWIIFAIFRSIDPSYYYFSATMIAGGILTAYDLRYSRVNKNPIQGGSGVAYVIVWLAMVSFSPKNRSVEYSEYSLELKQLEFIAIIPLAVTWVLPYTQDKFFGKLDLEPRDRYHAIWRSSVLILIIINIIELPDKWYANLLEFTILIPMIFETVQLNRMNKEKLPVLTLFVTSEISEKLEIPFSLMKSVFFIMVAFLFEILNSRFWLLVILAYFAAVAGYLLITMIPQDMRGEEGSEEFAETIRKAVGEKDRRRNRRSKQSRIKLHDAALDVGTSNQENHLTTIKKTTNLSTELSNETIPEKAHALGQRVRSSIEKPYYTLNHILSTLKEEDFSKAWKVPKEDLVFPSLQGNWSPPKGLILVPIELEKYDYRRINQVLLLGFNQPIDQNDGSMKFEFGGGERGKTKIGPDLIRFGDVEFNTRSLIVSNQQWEEIKPFLETVSQSDDISYTGFSNLEEMQRVLASMSDKWLEVRFTIQEAAVNFLAGFLGSSEPIFIPKEGIEAPKTKMIKGEVFEEDESEEK